MSDLADEPSDDDITYADTREAQNQLQGLIREDDDYQEAVEDQHAGDRPEDPPANAAMP
jgi:hypothetical protein